MADKFEKKSYWAKALICMSGCALSLPLMALGTLQTSSFYLCVACYALKLLVAGTYSGPAITMIQNTAPLDQQANYDHLAGKYTLGLYPLLEDNRCWLLAADFDKSDWKEAVTAFRRACAVLNVPFSVERSRSGNGAHIWVFFESPVLAKDARQLGFILLDKAMEFHAGLSFESYDRLFPNQDVLPVGGFGNLIALPLQHNPRQQGNSVFIDENFN